MGSWWERNIVEPGKLPLLLCLVAFVVTFLATRAITRLIRSGRGPFKDNVSEGGLHIHHAVPGIILLVIGAVAAIAAPEGAPWRELAAMAIGVGTSLVLDEFALILHLDDVYWSAEGRVSVQMVSLAVACMGLALVGFNPLGVDDVESTHLAVRIGAVIGVLVNIVMVAVAAVKGKLVMALIGIFVPLVAWFAAVRLARPRSRWARRYERVKLEKAAVRSQRFAARWDPIGDRISDFIAGSPST